MPRRDGWQRRLGPALLACALAVLAGACGGDRPPVRVGLLVACATDSFVPTRDVARAAAGLPLVARGATPAGDGSVHGGRAGGRRVVLVPLCTELTDLSGLIATTRQAVEEERVDVV